MNFWMPVLKPTCFLTVASAVIWIGSAAAEPLPMAYASNSGAFFDSVMRGQAAMDETAEAGTDTVPHLRRQVVSYPTKVAAGTIIIDTAKTYLYYVLGDGKAIRYGIGVGRDGFTWSGSQAVTRMAEWPDWTPPPEMIERQPYLPRWMAGGNGNPLGARAIYLGNTIYRIHGTNMPATIGQRVSSGCIRMLNADVIDLYNRVKIGTNTIVLPDHANVARNVLPTPVAPVRFAAPQTYNLRAGDIY